MLTADELDKKKKSKTKIPQICIRKPCQNHW